MFRLYSSAGPCPVACDGTADCGAVLEQQQQIISREGQVPPLGCRRAMRSTIGAAEQYTSTVQVWLSGCWCTVDLDAAYGV